MGRFESVRKVQRFLPVHSAVTDLLNLGGQLVSAENYRQLRAHALEFWSQVAARIGVIAKRDLTSVLVV